MGITFICQTLRPGTFSYSSVGLSFGLSFYAISVSLNILLTLMIVTRLILHNRNIRNAMGTAHKPAGLYNAVVTMLIESCAIYAVTYILYIAPWSTENSAQLIFSPILTVAQVRAGFLNCNPGALPSNRGGTNRSSARSSLSNESPTRPHSRPKLSSPGTLARFISRVGGNRRLATKPLRTGIS